jgi:uncharacterized protein YcbX
LERLAQTYDVAVSGPSTIAAVVSRLSTTPVKGLRIQTHDAVALGRSGVSGDRRFYLIDAKDRMVNGKQIRGLSAIVAQLDEASAELELRFPDGSSVAGTVQPRESIDTRFYSGARPAQLVDGPWSAALSAYAGQELRLVQPVDGAVDRGGDGAVSLIGRASVARLGEIAQAPVDARRFRMLVEVDGIVAHAEDAWVGETVRIGEALVLMRGHVGRCLVTGQDPDSGVPDLPTLDLLRSYRAGLPTTEPLALGIYGEVVEPGSVRVGDAVTPIA